MRINQHEPIYFTEPTRTSYKGSHRSGSLHKGPKAPKPDPLIGKAAYANAELGKQGMDFYTKEYERYRPQMEKSNNLADEVSQFQLDSSKGNAALADDYASYMKDTFRPIEKQLINTAQDYSTIGRQDAEAAKGVTDVKQAFAVQRGQTMRNNERMGINPNSGNASSIQGALDVQEALGSANAANQGRTRVESTGRAMLADAANMGRNLPSNQATSTQIASTQANAAQQANAVGNQQYMNGLNIKGQGFQVGMKGNESAADILNQNYQNRLQSFNAQQQSGASSAAGWGQLAGIGASFIPKLAEGGKVNTAAMGLDEAAQAVPPTEGRVAGPGTQTSDSIPARLSDGEGVLNAGAMKLMEYTLGLDAFDNINKQGLQFRGQQ